MTVPISTSTRNTIEDRRKNVATVIALALLIANILAMLYGISQSLSTFQQGRLPSSVGAVATAVLINALTLWIIQSGRVTLGASLLIGTTLILFTGVNLLVFRDAGLVFGIGCALLTGLIASQTLTARPATIAIIISIIIGFINIALDAYVIKLERTPAPIAVTSVLLASLTLIYGFLIIRQFNQFSVSAKLILLFVVLSVATVAALGVVTTYTTNILLTRLTNERLLSAAAEVGRDFEGYFGTAISDIRAEAQLPVFRDFLLTAPDKRTDTQKINLNSTLTILNRKDLNNISSYSLIDKDGVVLGDSFSIDIGTNKADRDYFQIPKETLNPYITPVRISPSSDDLSVYVSAPIRSTNGDFLGVLRVRYDAQILQEITYSFSGSAGESSFGILVDSDLVYLADGLTQNGALLSAIISPADQIKATQLAQAGRIPANPTLQRFIENRELQNGLQQAKNSTFTATLEQGNKQNYLIATYQLKNLPWKVAFVQLESVAYRPLQSQIAGTALVAFMIAAVVALLGVFAARVFTTPIERLSATANQIIGGDFSARAQVTSQDEIGTLATNFNTMTERLQETLSSLEQRVQERTRDLAIATEVGQRVATIRNTEQLLNEAVTVIQERFNLYYVQIYLLDTTGRTLIMSAGSGVVGKELKRRAFRLPVGTGLNGTAAADRIPVVVADTLTSATFRPNPLLPNTRSEMAIPLVIGERLLGVLNLQSDQANALNTDNTSVFVTLASQLAIALDNDILVAQANSAQQQLAAQAKRLTRQGWEEFLDGVDRRENFGVLYANEQVTEFTPQQETIKFNNNLSAPISVTGETIGVLAVEGEPNREWTSDEAALLEAIAAQAARQIEALRLLEQADEARAQAEFATRRLTREGWQNYVQEASVSTGYIYDLNQILPLNVANNTPTSSATPLSHPLKVGYETIGELAMSDVPNDEARELLSSIADQLSLHIENLRLAEQTQSALSETERLYRASRSISAANDWHDILAAALENIPIPAVASALLTTLTYDAQGEPEALEIISNWHSGRGNAPAAVNARIPIKGAPFFIRGETIFIKDAWQDPRFDPRTVNYFKTQGIRSMAVMPLMAGMRQVGVLFLQSDYAHDFTEAEIRPYTSLTQQMAVAIENRLLFGQAQKRAERETIINTINQSIQRTTSIEDAIQVATREIGQLLKAKRAVVEVSNLSKPKGA